MQEEINVLKCKPQYENNRVKVTKQNTVNEIVYIKSGRVEQPQVAG